MNRQIFLGLLFLVAFFLAACGSETAEVAEPTAVVAADSTAEPTPTVEPSPTAEPEPTATVEPTATTEPTPEPTTEPTLEPTLEPTPEPTAVPTEEPSPTAEPSPTPTTEPTEEPEPTAAPTLVRNFEILQDATEVRFNIDEVLLGNPKTVVGVTNLVTGEILLDYQNPQDVEISPIQVDARDLTTDDNFRNRALRSQILDSGQDEYQFITFTPTEISGLSTEAVVLGEPQSFDVTGDLQIRDIVQSVTFAMEVTAVSETELNGFGEVVVLRSDFDLQIPSVPGVANVADEVILEIDFVAQATDS